jgi:arabinan endo-1,5-alpha-L-arabinosidase
MQQQFISHFLVPLCLCLAMPLVVQSASPGKAVTPYDAADPTAVLTPDEKGLYVFSTGRGIPISYSANLIDGERTDRVFAGARFPDGMPDWAQKAIPGSRGLWAPDVVFLNNKYYVYYSVSTFGSQRSAIGLATNKTLDKTSPDYEWIDEGMVLESHPDHTDYNALDSALFVDEDGKTYLYWGSYWTGLKGVEVEPKTGKPFRYVPGELKIPADYVSIATQPEAGIEAAFVVRHGKYYYLFTSRGGCCGGVASTYHMAIGRSEKPLGPYVDKDDVRMDKGGGFIWLTATEKWKGPGHNGFFRTTKEGKNKGDWIVLHAYDAENPRNGRLTQIRPLYWDESDWPVLGDILSVPLDEFDFSSKKD